MLDIDNDCNFLRDEAIQMVNSMSVEQLERAFNLLYQLPFLEEP